MFLKREEINATVNITYVVLCERGEYRLLDVKVALAPAFLNTNNTTPDVRTVVIAVEFQIVQVPFPGDVRLARLGGGSVGVFFHACTVSPSSDFFRMNTTINETLELRHAQTCKLDPDPRRNCIAEKARFVRMRVSPCERCDDILCMCDSCNLCYSNPGNCACAL